MKLTITTPEILIRNIIISSFLAISLNLSGQKMASVFQEVKEIPKGKGVVYVYSVKKKYGYSYRLYANGTPIKPALFNGGYLIHYANPGYLTLSSLKDGNKDSLSVGIREGEVYFVEGSLKTGSFTGTGTPVLKLAEPASARKRIAECKLIVDD